MGFLSDLVENPVGALTGATASKRQVRRSTAGANQALQEGLSDATPYLQTFSDEAPGILSQLLSGDLNIEADPGYNFRLNEGLDAVQDRFAASGSPFSGSAAKALNEYAQGLASQEYGNRYARLSDLLRMGYGASANLADATLRASGAQAGNLVGAGQNSASYGFQGQQVFNDYLKQAVGALSAMGGGAPGGGGVGAVAPSGYDPRAFGTYNGRYIG